MNECVKCFEPYIEKESTAASEKELYCSLSCQEESEALLKEGNRIVDAALAQNPNAFLNTRIFTSEASEAHPAQVKNIDRLMKQMGYDVPSKRS